MLYKCQFYNHNNHRSMEQCWKFLKTRGGGGGIGVRPNTLYTRPIFPELCIYFMIKNCQIVFPKGVYRTPPENAFMNGYFYFYCVVKCPLRAFCIHEQIKKSSPTQKRTQTHHCREVICHIPRDSFSSPAQKTHAFSSPVKKTNASALSATIALVCSSLI
jgi:hypothetical protein